MTDLRPGMPAPEFTLPLASFGSISLSNMRGKPVVLYFYPKDDTPGCTLEACAFQANIPNFGYLDVAVVGISKDSVESHAAFAKKYGLQFHLASDAHADTCERYGVWVEKNNYGTKYMGIERTTFLIDRQGFIRAVWPKVKVEGHAEDVMAYVQALQLGQPLPNEQPPEPAPVAKPVAKPAVKAKTAAPVAKKKAVAVKAKAKPAAKKPPERKKPVEKKSVQKKPAKKAAAKKPVAKKPVAKKKAAKKKL